MRATTSTRAHATVARPRASTRAFLSRVDVTPTRPASAKTSLVRGTRARVACRASRRADDDALETHSAVESRPVALLAAGALLASALGGDFVPPASAIEPTQTYMSPVPASQPKKPSRYLTAEEQATINLFQKNTPSVVYITNVAQSGHCSF